MHDGAVVDSLPDDVAAELARAPFTYTDIGATASGPPDGYRHLTRTRTLTGQTLGEAAERLMTWQAQERAGLRVAASSPRAGEGVVLMMRLGIGALALRIPCRVVYVVEEPHRVGFAYGTLPGHPEEGEELFLLEQDRGRVRFTVSAFSKPATRLSRAGGPVSHWLQAKMTDRYLTALERR
ncbi:MAG: DUF1990 family protein [Frankiaceae bacterium]